MDSVASELIVLIRHHDPNIVYSRELSTHDVYQYLDKNTYNITFESSYENIPQTFINELCMWDVESWFAEYAVHIFTIIYDKIMQQNLPILPIQRTRYDIILAPCSLKHGQFFKSFIKGKCYAKRTVLGKVIYQFKFEITIYKLRISLISFIRQLILAKKFMLM
jgi:hypothetical protein